MSRVPGPRITPDGKRLALVPKAAFFTVLLAGAALGLAALFMDWTGDGRGIDYIQPGNRFQSGHLLPLPLTILGIGTGVGVGAIFLSGTASAVNLAWGRSAFLWLGGIGGLVVASFPLLAHFGYEFWRYYHEYGVGVFRSGDWGIGLWMTVAGGSLALAGTVLSAKWLRGRS